MKYKPRSHKAFYVFDVNHNVKMEPWSNTNLYACSKRTVDIAECKKNDVNVLANVFLET